MAEPYGGRSRHTTEELGALYHQAISRTVWLYLIKAFVSGLMLVLGIPVVPIIASFPPIALVPILLVIGAVYYFRRLWQTTSLIHTISDELAARHEPLITAETARHLEILSGKSMTLPSALYAKIRQETANHLVNIRYGNSPRPAPNATS